MSTTVEVPESQRLIALSLGKIAASRGQKGGINLHKNLLVATVLHKARTAYMIQQFARQRASQSPPPQPAATSSPPPANVEMREQDNDVPEPSSTTTTTVSSSSSPSAAAPTFPTAAPSSPAAPPCAGVAPPSESGSAPDGAAVSTVQVAESEDKENTPPPSPSHGDAEKRLQGDNKNTSKDCADKNATLSKPHVVSVTQTQKSTRDYVSKGCSVSSCLLKRRRAMASDHENVSAPKVRIVDTRLSQQQQQQQDSTPEPMQCDSPQISNLVNIFNSSFAGLSGAGAESSVRSVVGQSVLSVSTHMMSDSNVATCAKEMKVGLDAVRQPLVLSV